MPHFFVSLILIFIGILGLFVISLMLFSYRSNVFVNIYLVTIFILCSFRNIFIGLFEITEANTLFSSKHISPLYLIVVPSLYLYFKSLVKDYKHIYKKDLMHLIYPALNLALNIGQVHLPILKNQVIEDIRFISLVMFLLFYLLLSFNILYKKIWNKGASRSIEKRHYMLIKNWTLFIFSISAFLFLRILYSIYSEKMSHHLFRAQNYSFLVILPWFLIYGKILLSPEILYGYPKLKKRVSEIQNHAIPIDPIWMFDSIYILNLQDKKLRDTIKKRVLPYISDFENYVNKAQPFRNTQFSLLDFAQVLNIPRSHVNYIFKYHAIMTFMEYKNYCRIKDTLLLINKGYLDSMTLEALSNKVGFSSYNSFFTAFKKHTNVSPKDYLIQQNKTNL